MDTVTITSKDQISLDVIKSKLLGRLPVKEQIDPIVVEKDNSRVYIEHASDSLGAEKILNALYLNYSSLSLVKEVIVLIADSPDLIVENEYGTTLSGDQFVSWIKSDPELIWRCKETE